MDRRSGNFSRGSFAIIWSFEYIIVREMYIFLLATEVDGESTVLTVALEKDVKNSRTFAGQKVLDVCKQSRGEAEKSFERVLDHFLDMGCVFISDRSFCLARGKDMSHHIREFKDSVQGVTEAENTKIGLSWMDSRIKAHEETLKQLRQNKRNLKEYLESLPCERRQKSLAARGQ
ncbi:hypothetical protein [Brazilian marseillevirus]|uniref:hypothetical protein n=1 Tax=Brazilian marseillevirus TaxID=1813599 RepID=UPI000784B20E|nr:hypothetical protein A3303_gp105 [Brazilian marseillevirus]AMQ10613.1 hypothetical protein [Brazilian marseillevirus]